MDALRIFFRVSSPLGCIPFFILVTSLIVIWFINLIINKHCFFFKGYFDGFILLYRETNLLTNRSFILLSNAVMNQPCLHPFISEILVPTANQGNQYAQYTLGKLYRTGEDVRQNRELALHGLTASAQQGNEYAKFFLDRFDRIGNPNVLLSATKLLRHMGQIFRQNSIPPGNPADHRMDRNLLARIRMPTSVRSSKSIQSKEDTSLSCSAWCFLKGLQVAS